MKKFRLKIKHKDNSTTYISNMSEYDGSAPSPISFDSREAAETFAYINGYTDYIIEETNG